MGILSTCARCGATLAIGASFCSVCGALAGGDNDIAATRKHVCILFVDIVGSTSLAEVIDPEAFRDLLARYFQTVSHAVWQHGGTVEKFIGDAVMAVFGVPRAFEDDALRAVRASLKIIDDVTALHWDSSVGTRNLETRIGINAGEVFVTHQPDGQLSVTGDAVNVAARLQQRSEPGEILVGQSVADLVRDDVDLTFLGDIKHRGKSVAQGYYRATGRKKDNVGLHSMSFVGRDREMRELAAVMERVEASGQGWFITLVGEAGQGKSRLLHELLAQRPDTFVLKGAAQPSSADASSFSIVTEMLAALSADWPAYLRQLLGGDADPVLQRLESAVGMADGKTSLEDVAWALGRVIARIAVDRAVVLVWDDLHWASELQLDLVMLVMQEVCASATLTLCLTRPELFSLRPWWGGGLRSRVETIEALDDEYLEVMALEWRRINGGGARQARIAIRRSDGNPLVLRMLLASRADESLPIGVHSLFQAALDRLEPAERAFCEAGAIFGRKFSREAAAWVMGAAASSIDLDNIIRRLFTIHLLESAPAPANADRADLSFSQSLLMQRAYLSMPKQVRAQRHIHAAEWFSLKEQSDPRIFLHLYQALEELLIIKSISQDTDALREKVVTAGFSALNSQIRQGDPALVVTCRRLASLLPGDDVRLFDIMLTLWLNRGERDGKKAYEECFVIADSKLEGSMAWEKVRLVPAWMDAFGAGHRSAQVCRAEAVSLIEELNDIATTPPAALLFAYFYISQVIADLDGPTQCMQYFARGAEIARAYHHTGAERVFMSGALQCSLEADGKLDSTIELAEKMRADLRGVRRALPMIHGLLAASYALSGRLSLAQDIWDAGTEFREALSPTARVFVEQYFCEVLTCSGKVGEAASRYAALAQEARETPVTSIELESSAARLYIYIGEVERAGSHLKSARAMMAHIDPHHRFDRRLNTLEAAASALRGQRDRALALVPAFGDEDGEWGGQIELGYAAIDQAIVHAFSGSTEEAAQLLDKSREAFSAKGAVGLIPLIDVAAGLSAVLQGEGRNRDA